MQAECHAGKTLDDGVLGADRAVEILRRVLTPRPHAVERNLIDVGGETRSVHVHITAAGIHQLADHLALDCHDIRDEIVDVLVDGLGPLPGKALCDAIRPDQRHLDRPIRHRRGGLVFLKNDVLLQLQPFDRGAPRGDRRPGGLVVGLGAIAGIVRVAPSLRITEVLAGDRWRVVARHRVAEAVLEIAPPELAVGHDRQADLLLLPDDVADRAVFDGVGARSRKARREGDAPMRRRRSVEQQGYRPGRRGACSEFL